MNRTTMLEYTVVMPGGVAFAARAQDADQSAKRLSNPIARLTSMPMPFNRDDGVGADKDGDRFYAPHAWKAATTRSNRSPTQGGALKSAVAQVFQQEAV